VEVTTPVAAVAIPTPVVVTIPTPVAVAITEGITTTTDITTTDITLVVVRSLGFRFRYRYFNRPRVAIPILACPRAFDIQDLNRVLRQPICRPLSDVRIASRQMNPSLVMLLRELGGFLRSALSLDAGGNKTVASLSRTFHSVG